VPGLQIVGAMKYEHGEQMPFDDYLFVMKRILSSVQIPMSVDMEMGYGASDEEAYINILKLVDLGKSKDAICAVDEVIISGINIIKRFQ
jgi:2-methylisocitrate lyase-like PEP mutase family enzyme